MGWGAAPRVQVRAKPQSQVGAGEARGSEREPGAIRLGGPEPV